MQTTDALLLKSYLLLGESITERFIALECRAVATIASITAAAIHVISLFFSTQLIFICSATPLHRGSTVLLVS